MNSDNSNLTASTPTSVPTSRYEKSCPPNPSNALGKTTLVRVPEVRTTLVQDCYSNHGRGRSNMYLTSPFYSTPLQSHGGVPLLINHVRCWHRLRRLLYMTSSGTVQGSILQIEGHFWSQLGIPLSRFVLPHLLHMVTRPRGFFSVQQVICVNSTKANSGRWTSSGRESSVGSRASRVLSGFVFGLILIVILTRG